MYMIIMTSILNESLKLNLSFFSFPVDKNPREMRLLENGIKEHHKVIKPKRGSLGKNTWNSNALRVQADGRNKKNTIALC